MWRALRTASHWLPCALVAAAAPCALAAGEAPPLATTFPHGLTGPGCTERHYTAALDLARPLLVQHGSSPFMAAVRADARARLRLGPGGAALSPRDAAAVEEEAREHLASASAKRLKFTCSGTVHDREEVKAALRTMFSDRGQFALLLGGKSVGKSLLLGEMAQKRGEIVGLDGARRLLLYVDARSFGMDLAAGVLAAAQQEELLQKELEGTTSLSRKQQVLEAPRQQGSSAPSALPTPTKLTVSLFGAALETQLGVAGSAPPPTVVQCKDFIAQLAALVQRQGLYLCLIVDEANLAFPTPQDALLPPKAQGLAQLADTQLLLEKLVQLTKQTNSMNVLLVSSEYGYPHRLRHGRFFNTTNLTRTIFAGEVPPAAMRALLQQGWGLGPRAADVFLAYYGGHVHMAAQALAQLSAQLDDFDCESVAPDGVLGSILRSMRSEGSGGGGGGPMTAMLGALAGKGFAPVVEEEDALAQALSFANVGGLVKTSGTVVGLPKSQRSGASFGVVPSSHFVVRSRNCALHSSPCSCLSLFPTPTQTPTQTFSSVLLLLQRHLIAKALYEQKTSTPSF